MSVAVLARAPVRRLRPGTRRTLLAGASLVMHVVVLGSMVLLAASEEHPVAPPDLQPIIQLEIERPSLPPLQPILRPTPLLPEPTVEPLPTPTPERAVPTPERSAPAPLPTPAPTPAPQPLPQAPPRTASTIPPTPLPAPTRAPAPPAPAPVPAPTPAPPAAAERAAPAATAPVTALRPRKKDEDEARDGLPAAPAPRLANPAPGAPSAAASGVDGVSDAWRVAPEGQAGRNARALRTSPAGCPSSAILTRGEQAICDERLNARAAEGAQRAITGSGNAQRDARFAREGAREMQRYEQQRRPLSGGVGVLGPADCPGSNFGTGCAGAHLRDVQGVDMRQGARSTVNEGERRTLERPPQ
ncbi:hypothetical protein [Brevundimonas sp.]|uniref:hypothetical protein n=1 Tax=Brevundimonas sp. TaxID=1871086 RepID=UPI0028A80AC6|nr:hypothetical protein [Brevundimonas sp.]